MADPREAILELLMANENPQTPKLRNGMKPGALMRKTGNQAGFEADQDAEMQADVAANPDADAVTGLMQQFKQLTPEDQARLLAVIAPPAGGEAEDKLALAQRLNPTDSNEEAAAQAVLARVLGTK